MFTLSRNALQRTRILRNLQQLINLANKQISINQHQQEKFIRTIPSTPATTTTIATSSIVAVFGIIKARTFSVNRDNDDDNNNNNKKSVKQPTETKATVNMENKNEKIQVNKEELKKRLTPLQYQVTQEAGTERPFTGCYNKHYEKGVYQCIVCHQDLFSSDTKYDSGCGWPAFNDVLDKGKVTLHRDASIPGGNILLLIKHPERIRTEVRCARCNAHMGHVFEDGPKPTRKRYCINSASIVFVSADELNSQQATTLAATSPVPVPIAQQ